MCPHGRLPSLDEVSGVALECVRYSPNYAANGGFGERVVSVNVKQDLCFVDVEYQTRGVGMLEVIGQFVCHITINSITLEVVSATTETNYQTVEPDGTVTTEPGNCTGSDEEERNVTGPVDQDAYRFKISYTINATRGLIGERGLETNLTQALQLLDRARILLDGGDYDGPLDLALQANKIVNQFIYWSSQPGQEPDETQIGFTASS